VSDGATAGEPMLKGQTALVTGAGRGIGRAIATAFAAQGASVAMLARSENELAAAAEAINRTGGDARTWAADVTDHSAMRAVVADVERMMGPVGVLVNNAGALGPIGPLSDVPHDEWWHAVEVNVRGPATCMRLVLPSMQARRSGRIINVVSSAGVMSYTYFSAYVASKTALVRLTECVASEAKPYGVVAFAMEPGTVATSMSHYSVNSEDGQRWIPWFRRIFDEGLDAPLERVAARAVDLAAGRADALSGRFVPLGESLERLVAHAVSVRRDRLYSLRIERLEPPVAGGMPPALAALRAEAEQASSSVIQLRANFPVPRERAFGAWVDPRAIEQWFLPESGAHWLRPPQVSAIPGGTLSLEVAAGAERFHLFGRFRQVEPARRLVLDWAWNSDAPGLGEGSGSRLTVDFVDAESGTEVIILHEHFATETARDAHLAGWARSLAGMQRLFRG
jgi:NAD(P)-dependent dehydrogenase (short-subunit alcohol dehydrogenase family)/uncharacterized protein YndB with AHSA1/START domain